jgi:hypothetical protein
MFQGQPQNYRPKLVSQITGPIRSLSPTCLHYDCCEHLGSKLKLDAIKLLPELPLKNVFVHSNAFKYASHSVDQVERIIIQNEAEFNEDHKIDHLIFLSYLGMATMVALGLLIYCCFCKKYNLLRKFLDDDCCGRICISQTVINQREINSSDENVTDRFLNQETRSHSLRSLPAAAIPFQWEALTHGCVRLINVDGRTMFLVILV